MKRAPSASASPTSAASKRARKVALSRQTETEPSGTRHQASAKPARRATGEPQSWRRHEDDQFQSEELGRQVRAVREKKGLSLAALSEASGVPAATLSRIENNKMSPTFGVLVRVMKGLDVDWGQLMGNRRLPSGSPLISFADPGSGTDTVVRKSSAKILHAVEGAQALPLLVEVQAVDLTEAGGLSAHAGQEFCYVLAGTLILQIGDQPPRTMKAGASALFDSSIPHAYLTRSGATARVLIVSHRSA